MDNKISIRAARPADSDGLLALWKRSGIRSNVTDEKTMLRVRLGKDRDLFLVACHGSRIVGSLIAGWDGWRGSMARLAVDPAYRGKRIAQRLVAHTEARLRKRGAKRIGALVFADNKLGQRFWRAAGYRREPTITRFVKNL
jgi:ribosomal protein S18 acetylase RimI-like enzyme